MGEYASAKWIVAEKKMESLPRLGLGIIYVVSFMEGLILLPEHVSKV